MSKTLPQLIMLSFSCDVNRKRSEKRFELERETKKTEEEHAKNEPEEDVSNMTTDQWKQYYKDFGM